jgi:hypothetical protein
MKGSACGFHPACSLSLKGAMMRMLLNITLPNLEFNSAVKDGTISKKLNQILEETKPEAVYFTEQHGQRSVLMIAEVDAPSKVPMLAEPWFLTFNANVELRVVMTPEDLKSAGLDDMAKKWTSES